jgi:glycosyltransferase involved in cell wall biosynthesis
MIRQLTRYLAGQGWPTTILAAGPATTPAPAGVSLVEFPSPFRGRGWRFPRGLIAYLRRGNQGHRILHLHGVWMAPQWLAARTSVQQGLPAILTPHNMLAPWLWQNGPLRRLKKLAYWHLMAYPAFGRLAVIHAITPRERDQLAPYFPGRRLEIIPNAIDLEEADRALNDSESETIPGLEPPYFLFLGRLHPIKGVDRLIAGFAAALKGRACRLLIAGPDSSPAYTLKLKTLVRQLEVERQVIFLGPVFGPQKWRLYRHAWAVCNPSYTEVIGLVNLEGASAAVPVITTPDAGLPDWEAGGGVLVAPEVTELSRALAQAFSWNDRERLDRGRGLRRLVASRYSWSAVGPRWLELYATLR